MAFGESFSLVAPGVVCQRWGRALGKRAVETQEAEVCLALAEVHAGEDFGDGFVEGEFDGEVVLDARDFGPGGLFAGEEAALHEVGGGVGEDLREVGVGNGGEDGDVA